MPALTSLSKEDIAERLTDIIRRQDAHIERLESFLRRFLNPEELGLAVPAHVRDDVREILDMPRVES